MVGFGSCVWPPVVESNGGVAGVLLLSTGVTGTVAATECVTDVMAGATGGSHLGMGSPYSSSGGYAHDEYEFEDEDAEDDRDLLEMEDHESDEDTEDASETDMMKSQEEYTDFTEIKEQMYRDKLMALKKQLQQLKDGVHPEYNRRLKRLEQVYRERLHLNDVWREYESELAERDYVCEKRAAAREFEEKKIELRESLIAEMEEKRKMVEVDRHSMELTGDSMEVKPATTRKLRRRPNDPIPMPEKRRKAAPAQLNYLLDEREVDEDLRLMIKARAVSTTVKKPITNQSQPSSMGISSMGDSYQSYDARVEDGKLFYEKRWFHRGQQVFVEGKDQSKFSAVVSAIGSEAIWVRKTSDNSKVRIYLTQLSRGKYVIKRRAS